MEQTRHAPAGCAFEHESIRQSTPPRNQAGTGEQDAHQTKTNYFSVEGRGHDNWAKRESREFKPPQRRAESVIVVETTLCPRAAGGARGGVPQDTRKTRAQSPERLGAHC